MSHSIRNSTITIDLAALRHNITTIKQATHPARLVGVIKANAYGHGAILVAKELVSAGVDMLAVATVHEGIELRAAGFNLPIHVLAGPLADQLELYRSHNLDITIPSIDAATMVASSGNGKPVRVHVKVDTGMGRLGCRPDELEQLLHILSHRSDIQIVSLWSHFARSTDTEGSFSRTQLSILKKAAGRVGGDFDVHIASSNAMVTFRDSIDFGPRSWARIGVALYGMMDQRAYDNTLDLKPVMKWTSRLVQIKIVDEGTPISYGGRWVASQPTLIGTVGAGYADGYSRQFSNIASVGIRGKRYPVVGTVCMDMFMVNLGDPAGHSSFRPGDEVVLMGEGGPSIFDLADWANTISYEIATGITVRAGRQVVG